MAALGSLRRNSFVLISVIGMALFAFVIAGVFDGSGFQSQDPIGEVNGEKISITDFRNQVDWERNRKAKIKSCTEIRPRGSIIVFPSFVWHRVKPVTSGTRYSLVVWHLGRSFK